MAEKARFGRPRNKYPQRVLKISCTDSEFDEIIDSIPNTRQRALILLSKAKRMAKENVNERNESKED